MPRRWGRTSRFAGCPPALSCSCAGRMPGSPREADAVWPDPERVTIVADGSGPLGLQLDILARLLPLLPLGATDGVRLCWPRAGAGAAVPALQELAAIWSTDLIAPAADISP